MLFAMLALVAQVGRPRPPGPPPEAVGALGVVMVVYFGLICFGVVIGIVGLVITIMDLIAMYKALSTVRKRNRTMEPGMLFLVFVPLLGVVWTFLNVIRVTESLRNEYEDRGWDTRDETFGYGKGLTAAVLNLIVCAAPIGLVFLFLHWRQVSACTQALVEGKRGR